jgi:hypothetical protein
MGERARNCVPAFPTLIALAPKERNHQGEHTDGRENEDSDHDGETAQARSQEEGHAVQRYRDQRPSGV